MQLCCTFLAIVLQSLTFASSTSLTRESDAQELARMDKEMHAEMLHQPSALQHPDPGEDSPVPTLATVP